jgi:hypothetical protein
VAAGAPAAARKLVEAEPAAAHKLVVAAAVKADLPEADIRDNMEVANSSKAVVVADMEGACPEVHTICNNRNSIPSTSPLRLVSKSTGNSHSATDRQRLRPESA